MRRTLVSAVVATIVTSCSSNGPARATEPPIVEVSVEDLRTFEFPLDRYLNAGGPSSDVELKAYRVLFSSCMSRFGFTAEVPLPGPSPMEFRARMYGLADMDDALQYGYTNPLSIKYSSPEAAAAPTAAYQAVAGGGDAQHRTHNGLEIPEGGCSGDAERTLDEGAPPVDDPYFGQALRNHASNLAEQDSRVVAVLEAWSECMSHSGYDYADPSEANNDPAFDGTDPTPAEIAVATADVACKEEVDLIDIRAAVEVAYQERVIEENAEVLAELLESLEVRRRNAAEIVEREG